MLRLSPWWGIAPLTLSCSAVLGIDGLVADRVADGGAAGVEGGTAEGGGESGADGGGCASTCGTPGCGACPQPPRVPSGGAPIDVYEVSAADYAAWLATKPTLSGQRPECTWNDSFVPGVVSPKALAAIEAGGKQPDPGCAGWLDKAIEKGDLKAPVVCADWCDAAAYCKWAKGHLCGALGGASQIYQDDRMPARGEWWTACTDRGQHAYPYGASYVRGTCNDSNSRIFDVGTYPNCKVNGAFDLSGNVTEWEDSCSLFDNPPEAENCLRRGGAFWEDQNGLSCAAYRETTRGFPDANTGFRCCE
jgi:formylglycine-generating enzyme required for sulfatase activity